MFGLKKDEFGRVTWHVARLGGPIALIYLANMAMQIVAMVFVGHLGTEQLAGFAVGNAIFGATMVTGIGLLLGLDYLAARAFGAGKQDEVNRLLVQAFYYAAGLSVVITLVMRMASYQFVHMGIAEPVAAFGGEYLRALSWSLAPFLLFTVFRQYLQSMGLASPILWVLVVANIVNFGANAFLVPHPRFGGVAGSGWATVFARTFVFVSVAGYALYFSHKKKLGLWKTFRHASRPSFEILGQLVRLGFPAGVQFLFEVGVFATFTLIAGRLGAVPLAAHQIALQIASVTFMVPLGIASAGAVRVAQAIGAQDRRQAMHAGWISIVLGGVCMIVFGIILLIVPQTLLGFFSADPSVRSVGAGLLFITAFFQLFDGVQVVSSGVLRGLGNTRISMMINLIGHWGIGLPTGVALCFWAGWGVYGIWIGLSVGLTLVAVSLAVAWHRLCRVL